VLNNQNRWRRSAVVGLLAAGLLVGCGDDGDGGSTGSEDTGMPGGDAGTPQAFDESCTTTVAPRGSAEASTTALEEAFITSDEGAVICMTDGEYMVKRELTLTKNDIEIRGQSRADTVLNFEVQEDGANGILVQAGENFVARDFTIKNTPSDALKAKGIDGVVMKNLKVTWDGGPSEENGTYTLYPVQSENVLVEDSVVEYARDAGVYLGQSETAILRNNRAVGNVVGLEIENTFRTEAYGNTTEENTNGILVINLPDLMVKGGGDNLVYDNTVVGNNEPNFGEEGTAVSNMPAGSGIVVLASDDNEIRDNTVENNDSLGLAMVSFALIEAGGSGDPEYDPIPEGNWVHDNDFSGNGSDPVAPATIAQREDGTNPTIFWDGRFDDSKDNSDGSLTNCFENNTSGSGETVEPAIVAATEQCPDEPSESKMCSLQCSGSSVEPVELPERIYEMAGSEPPQRE